MQRHTHEPTQLFHGGSLPACNVKNVSVSLKFEPLMSSICHALIIEVGDANGEKHIKEYTCKALPVGCPTLTREIYVREICIIIEAGLRWHAQPHDQTSFLEEALEEIGDITSREQDLLVSLESVRSLLSHENV